jgi:hypothetical protein
MSIIKVKNKQVVVSTDFDFGGNKITNLANPTESTDGVTLGYLTSNFTTSLSGLTDVTLDTPEDQQVLRYSGGTWINSNDYWTEDVSGNTITPTNVDLDVQLNSIEIKEDSGAITIMDMSVSGIPNEGTEESYSFDIDGTKMLRIYSEADGASGITNTGVVIEADYQYIGNPNIDGSWRLYTNDNNQLVVEKRESSSWVASGIFT